MQIWSVNGSYSYTKKRINLLNEKFDKMSQGVDGGVLLAHASVSDGDDQKENNLLLGRFVKVREYLLDHRIEKRVNARV